MLKLAQQYKESLPHLNQEAYLKKENRFFYGGYWDDFEIKNDNWTCYQFVSVDNTTSEVLGYIKADVDRQIGCVYKLGAICFSPNKKNIFAIDFARFIEKMFIEYKHSSINYSIAIGSPHEKMYDKFTKKLNGTTIGVFHKYFMAGGDVHDMKFYEIMREDFLNSEYYKKRLNNE